MAQRKTEETKDSPGGKNMSESSPNPHGENKVLEMPINTDQRNTTGGKNVAKIPNTAGGRLNPSVAHDFENRVRSDEANEKATQENRSSDSKNEKKEVTLGKKKKEV
jgi:hypothetical protein